MEMIYYCKDCEKFHFANNSEDSYHQCPHCNAAYAMKTNITKDAYNEMNNDEKNNIKNEIKTNYNAAYLMKLINKKKQAELQILLSKKGLLYDIQGCRGRSIKVYHDRCIIETSVTGGSIVTGNATDGEKTIFYSDVIGIQFKQPGLLIGYLQLETASPLTNNVSSNAFNENTFTFEKTEENMIDVKNYIIERIATYKQAAQTNTANDLKIYSELFEKGLLTEEEFTSLKNKFI